MFDADNPNAASAEIAVERLSKTIRTDRRKTSDQAQKDYKEAILNDADQQTIKALDKKAVIAERLTYQK